MNGEFIDLHCHILPKLDEGASTAEEAARMLLIARQDGIAGVVATPHILAGLYNNTKEIINHAISELTMSANHFPIYSGAEIRIGRNLAARVADGELPLINNKRFMLLELPAYVIPPVLQLENIVKGLKGNHITPIFAHPERNVPLQKDSSIVERLIGCGALFQMTASSLSHPDLRGPCLKMIRKGFVHAIATDAHDTVKRPPILSRAYDIVSRKIDKDTANRLFMHNPLKIIRGEDLEQCP